MDEKRDESSVFKARRDGNRILYRLEEHQLAASVGAFLAVVCPEQVVLRRRQAAGPD